MASSPASRLSDSLAGVRIGLPVFRRADDLAEALRRHGALTSIAAPISIVSTLEDPELLAGLRAVPEFRPDVVVASTGVGFRAWSELFDKPTREALRRAEIVSRGPKPHGAVAAAGFDSAWIATSEQMSEVAEYLSARGVRGRRIVVQQHGAGDEEFIGALREAGAEVLELTFYRVVEAPSLEAVDEQLRQAAGAGSAPALDAVVFTSAPAAQAWLARAEALGVSELLRRRARPGGSLYVAAVGPVTAAPLEEAGLCVDQPERYRLGALVKLVVAHFRGASAG